MNENEKLAVFAGLLVGEGSFSLSIKKRKNKRGDPRYGYRAVMQITNTDKAIADWIQENFGHMGWHYGESKKLGAKSRKIPYYFRLDSTRKVKNFLPLIMPYLIAKRRQAELLLEYCDLREKEKLDHKPNHMRHHPREWEIRKEIMSLNCAKGKGYYANLSGDWQLLPIEGFTTSIPEALPQ